MRDLLHNGVAHQNGHLASRCAQVGATPGQAAGPLCEDLRIDAGADERAVLRFTFDGRAILARQGETVAAALWAAGHRSLRTTAHDGEPRGVFCNMGVCFDCLVEVDGRPNVRACQEPVAEGLRVSSQRGAGDWGGRG